MTNLQFKNKRNEYIMTNLQLKNKWLEDFKNSISVGDTVIFSINKKADDGKSKHIKKYKGVVVEKYEHFFVGRMQNRLKMCFSYTNKSSLEIRRNEKC